MHGDLSGRQTTAHDLPAKSLQASLGLHTVKNVQSDLSQGQIILSQNDKHTRDRSARPPIQETRSQSHTLDPAHGFRHRTTAPGEIQSSGSTVPGARTAVLVPQLPVPGTLVVAARHGAAQVVFPDSGPGSFHDAVGQTVCEIANTAID